MFVFKSLNTVRYLQPKQILGQIRVRLSPLYERVEKFNSESIPPFVGCRWSPTSRFLPPAPQSNLPADILRGRLTFLNDMQDIGWPPEWNKQNLGKLWQYNLHYFDYIWALEYDQARMLVLDWIANYPLQRGKAGWEPYPISLRLMNLCGAFFGKYGRQTEADTVFLQKLYGSIYLQAEWLARHTETHLLGNHLFENGAALAFVGSCFNGSAAEKWYDKGKGIVVTEISKQILTDGMHFERSPMYHLRITYLLTNLLNVNKPDLNDILSVPLSRMVAALEKLCHPDGKIALLNDSAFGIYTSPFLVSEYARELLKDNKATTDDIQTGAFALSEVGYYGFHDREGTYVICDAGPIGPDYIPGHAHADIFSFELSVRGCRVIVDSGVYDYEIGPMRQYCRSTKSHNTVEIGGQDQCEMWAAFRVGHRGRPRDVKWLATESGFQLSAWHDGYTRLKGKPVHRRNFTWYKSGRLTVEDKITASCSQNVISRLHLHPDCTIDDLRDNSAWIAYPAGKFKVSFIGDGKLLAEDSFYCPEFGIKDANTALAFSFSRSRIEAGFQIETL